MRKKIYLNVFKSLVETIYWTVSFLNWFLLESLLLDPNSKYLHRYFSGICRNSRYLLAWPALQIIYIKIKTLKKISIYNSMIIDILLNKNQIDIVLLWFLLRMATPKTWLWFNVTRLPNIVVSHLSYKDLTQTNEPASVFVQISYNIGKTVLGKHTWYCTMFYIDWIYLLSVQ